MGTTTSSAFGPLVSGIYFLWRHKIASLGIVLLASLLAELGPVALRYFQLQPTEINLQLFHSVSGLPLALYVVPRFVAYLDAMHVKAPENRLEDWKAHFEKRWGLCVATKLMLYVALVLGLFLFIFPGLLAIFFLGWAPLRVLLRGETLQSAVLGSIRMAKVHAREILRGFFLLCLVYLGLLGAMVYLAGLEGLRGNITLRALTFVGQILALWFSLGILALFHQTEHAQEPL